MIVVVKGKKPPADEADRLKYLRQKLAELRKNCQWLAALGVAEVFGVLVKDALGSATPEWRLAVFAVSGVQIIVAIIGAFSWAKMEVDNAQMLAVLERRFNARYRLRNFSTFLLVVSLALVAVLGWHGTTVPKG